MAKSLLTTNLAENSMRPVALGRKNWIHVGSPQAGPKVAAILSVVESCRCPVRNPGEFGLNLTRIRSLVEPSWLAGRHPSGFRQHMTSLCIRPASLCCGEMCSERPSRAVLPQQLPICAQSPHQQRRLCNSVAAQGRETKLHQWRNRLPPDVCPALSRSVPTAFAEN